jgi:general secretion pathway protein G
MISHLDVRQNFPPASSHALRPKQSASFTLVELLVVIAIVGLLAGLAVPAIGKARETANRGRCAGNLKGLSTAVLNYIGLENNGCIPMLYGNEAPSAYNSWFAVAVGATDKATGEALQAAGQKGPSCLYCPSMKWPLYAGSTKVNWYQGVSYGLNSRITSSTNNGVYTPSYLNRIAKPSQVIMLADGATHEQDGDNAFQINNMTGAAGGMGDFSKRHGGGVNIAWFDGHVTWEGPASVAVLSNTANRTNWLANP